LDKETNAVKYLLPGVGAGVGAVEGAVVVGEFVG
jgi:hypothetical protein